MNTLNEDQSTFIGEIRYREFPELLFLEYDGKLYFNASHYINKKGNTNKHSIEDFLIKFGYWIEVLSEIYSIDKEFISIHSKQGYILIDESFSLLFICYIDKFFTAHFIEKMTDMLIEGVSISDTALISLLAKRFSTKELLSILGET